jgi:hypothetical protein
MAELLAAKNSQLSEQLAVADADIIELRTKLKLKRPIEPMAAGSQPVAATLQARIEELEKQLEKAANSHQHCR